jgi:hypothetical protein
MGGFHLFIDFKYPLYPLHRDTIKKLHLQKRIKLPNLSEIQDKGKKATLVDFLVLIQVSWFIMNTIARANAALTITKLELITIAYISMNLCMYCMWWDKPKNIKHPIRVHVGQIGIIDTKKKRDHTSPGFGNINRGKTTSTISQSADYLEIARNASYLFFGSEQDSVDVTSYKAVPTFYSGKPGSGRTFQSLFFAFSVALVRSAILGIAWSYGIHQTAASASATEPISVAELVLWRVSTLAPCGFMLLCLITIIAAFIIEPLFHDSNLFKPYKFALQSMLLFLGVFYVIARNMSLVLGFMELRFVSTDAYETVYWTSCIPHI